MVGVILLTHGSLGIELLKTSEMIIGKQDKVDFLSVQSGASLGDLAGDLDRLINKYKDGGVLILTDMFGGSPSNIAMAYLEKSKVDVVTGVNLPMLIKTFSMRKDIKNPQELGRAAIQTGKESIILAGDLMTK
ncbi:MULTISPECIES: PTS sugar transporter subunit IIA [Flexistipes]|uniref:PTS system fructose subfamily IIA component n=2 Tax=Flexistipes sinusarabici TaxID=2352 RepID=F8E5L7_FLESM|nr:MULTISPECIES: PTS sugar transporter subunit IIA [Flexistipes]AEI14648.1 PTS system fructose subfamily IIA component [Flexistipes sinusarabici DSM 4947]MEC9493113.1 PTS sugar transporter subunit IIA [Flexistipes sp.]